MFLYSLYINTFFFLVEKILKYLIIFSPIQNKENVSTVITDFNVIMESGEYSDLSKFVSR